VDTLKQVIPEIYVRDCKNALSFYQDTFGGEIKNLQMSEDLPFFQDQPGKVVHSELHVNGRCVFYFVDIFDERRKHVGNMTLMLHMDSMEELNRVYEKLQERGTVEMPLQKTFWGAWHAIITDQYGAPWALNYAPQ